MTATTLPANGLRVRLTYYVISLRPPNDPDEVSILECGTGRILTKASRAWRADAVMEGTARYRDAVGESRTINTGGNGSMDDCWTPLDYDHRWGLGVTDKTARKPFALRPFRSMAVDPKVMTIGKWYYVKELDGLQMPYPVSTLRHDGRVRAVDVGPDIVGKHIDFFVGYLSSYRKLDGLPGNPLGHVTVFEIPASAP